MVSPRVKRERRTEQRVPMGLNMETKTGPLFFMAHPLKLTHAPLTVPPCICIFIHSFFFKCIVMKGFHISIWTCQERESNQVGNAEKWPTGLHPVVLEKLHSRRDKHADQRCYGAQRHWCWKFPQRCGLYIHKYIKEDKQKQKHKEEAWILNTCKTTLVDKAKTAARRYKQPMILCLSKKTSWVVGGVDVMRLVAVVAVVALCIMLIVKAPPTHTIVPTIFTLLYLQLSFTFSNLPTIFYLVISHDTN